MGNAGTAARFLLAGLASAPWGQQQEHTKSVSKFVLRGSSRMEKRPMSGLVAALAEQGVQFSHPSATAAVDDIRALPISVESAGLRGGAIEIDGTDSSQFVSALLMAAPLAHTDVTLAVRGSSAADRLVSRPYIDLTLDLLRQFGAQVAERPGESTESGTARAVFEVKSGSLTPPAVLDIEGDASSAAYPLVRSLSSRGHSLSLCRRV